MTKPDEAQVTGQSLPQESGYVIVSEIGRGGMGIVYRAHDVKLGRLVALKRPKPEVMALPDFSRRFLREARTASRLLHPNITTVFAAYEENGVPWLVMELVEGVSLRTRLASGEPLPVNEIVEHGEGLADALRAAHEQGILHSDVNPNNILIGRDGRARLTDFGLARARNAPGALPVFDAAEVPTWSVPEAAGTRGYMAPEHLRGAALDPRSDIYCLGLVLYEMCVGTPVFAGKSTVEWVGAAMDGETERLARLGPGVPPELARVVAKATATKPGRRYQSAAEMAADLRALRRYRESGVEIAVAAAARARKRTSYGLLAAALVVAAAGAVALLSWRSGGPPVLRSRPLTSAPGLEEQPALSPDGRLVAYTSNEIRQRRRLAGRPAHRGEQAFDDRSGGRARRGLVPRRQHDRLHGDARRGCVDLAASCRWRPAVADCRRRRGPRRLSGRRPNRLHQARRLGVPARGGGVARRPVAAAGAHRGRRRAGGPPSPEVVAGREDDRLRGRAAHLARPRRGRPGGAAHTRPGGQS